MSTTKQLESAPAVPPEDLAELEAAVSDLVRGRRDRAAMERAARDLEEGREETRRRLGETDVAVDLTDRDGV